jgi:hypothetical protein
MRKFNNVGDWLKIMQKSKNKKKIFSAMLDSYVKMSTEM